MRIVFLGAGRVGAPLAARLAEAGHEVTLAETGGSGSSVQAALARSPRLTARPLPTALDQAEVVFLATPFGALPNLLPPLAEALAGRTLVDCTNPVGPGLTHALGSARSGSALIQELAPQARVVKAFNIYGYENLENPNDPTYPLRPAMLFCGDDPQAKAQVSQLIDVVGFEPVDVGGLIQALHLEHLTLLWVRRVRVEGASPRWVWASLQRAAAG